jgi:hypothetical protein
MITKDTILEKITDIETVLINPNDYEKLNYSFALKKVIDYGLGVGTTNSSFEIGLRFNKNQIIFTPTTRKANKANIDVQKYNISFPIEGVVVTVKWIPIKNYDGWVGPGIGFTNYTEKLTYTRYNNDDSKWGNDLNFSKKNGIYTNAMIGLDVYFKKKKMNKNE